MTRKHGHWGSTGEAKEWASRARRRDETAEVAAELDGVHDQPGSAYAGNPVGLGTKDRSDDDTP